MNKRIERLRAMAGLWASNQLPFSNPEWTELRDQKFAELIIEECASQCWTVSELEHKGDVVYECSKRIRKHFGVDQ